MYKAVVLDMDGTMLDSKGDLSQKNYEAINKVKKQGVRVFVVSGRTISAVVTELDKYGLKCDVIGLNGAEIMGEDGQRICEAYLNMDLLINILEICNKYQIVYRLYDGKKVLAREVDNMLDLFINIAKGMHKDVRNILKQAYHSYDIMYGGAILVKDIISHVKENNFRVAKLELLNPDRRLLDMIAQELSVFEEISITSSHDINLEISHKDAHKGSAIKNISKELNINKEAIIAIGDNKNDIPMLKEVGMSVAMGNALNEVKEKADFVTKSNDEDGVAYALEELILNKKIALTIK